MNALNYLSQTSTHANPIGKIRDIISRSVTGKTFIEEQEGTLYISITSTTGTEYTYTVHNLYTKFSSGITCKQIAVSALEAYKSELLKTEFKRKIPKI